MLDRVVPHIEGPCLTSVEIVGHMNQRQRLDALAEIWEHIGDDELIEHMRREGFEVRRIEQPCQPNQRE